MMISELITELAEDPSRDTVARIETIFPDSVFGLLVEGLPNREPGTTYTLGAHDDVRIAIVADPDGKRMIKACADPPLFDRNYPGNINVTMTGRDLVEMALKMKRAEGILVCSATSFDSYPIYKNDYQRLLKRSTEARDKRRWQFWRRT